jgi:hypothetical protein
VRAILFHRRFDLLIRRLLIIEGIQNPLTVPDSVLKTPA